MKALIVDDEREIGMIISRILEKSGIDAKSVVNLESARRIISENHFGLFFLDINLTDGSGFDLIPYIHEHTAEPLIIMISAYEDQMEYSLIKEHNADLFLKKPFTKHQVLEAVNELI